MRKLKERSEEEGKTEGTKDVKGERKKKETENEDVNENELKETTMKNEQQQTC